MMTDKDQTGDPEPPGGTDPGLAQQPDDDVSAFGDPEPPGSMPAGTGDPEPPGGTGDPEPPGGTGGI